MVAQDVRWPIIKTSLIRSVCILSECCWSPGKGSALSAVLYLEVSWLSTLCFRHRDPDPPCVGRLVIWPGFTTSILQYENNIMLCTDVSHKVLRSETVLDFMFSLYQQTEEHKFQEQVSKELIGLIVLTKYGLASSQEPRG